MLSVLRAKNFILIDELELVLEPGLNVLTGETGAGKSIVVGAINLVLGGKASADHVRPGATEAEVEALFDLSKLAPDAAIIERLRTSGAFGDGPAEDLAIRRVVQQNGRSRSYVNGKLRTAADLVGIAPELADVSSQHESVKLTDPSTHLDHLDRFASLMGARAELARAVEDIEALVKNVRELSAREKTRGEREAFVRFMLQAITDVDPKPGEIDDLGAERKRLRHAGKLVELLTRSNARLDGEEGVCDQVARVASDMRAAAELDQRLVPLAKSLDGAYSELREVASECARYADGSGGDPMRLGAIEERLYRLEGLLRQHGPALDQVIEARARLEEELDGLTNVESRIAEQEKIIADRLPAVTARARALSSARKRSAEELGKAISGELVGLGMGGARVLVEVEPASPRAEAAGTALSVDGARLGRDGIDRVEFLIAPNKGLEPKPLRKIASGGELSRALLALKRVLADHGPGGLYVFDEVDTGVGGAVAERIGAAIADVASHHQVLCITHVAPIAAFADAHFVVTKSSAGETASSTAKRVRGDERAREVARMLSGAKITEATERAAREMIRDADGQKKNGSAAKPVAPRAEPKKTQPEKRARR